MQVKQQGFTLIELVVVIAILAIIAALGSYLLAEGVRAFFIGRDITAASQRINMALDYMSRDLTGASRNSVNIPSASTLTFIDSNNNNISYTLSGRLITRQENAGIPQALVGSISALTFTTATINGASYVTVNTTIVRGGSSYATRMMIYPRNS